MSSRSPRRVFVARRYDDTERQFKDEKRPKFASRVAERRLAQAEGEMRGRGFRSGPPLPGRGRVEAWMRGSWAARAFSAPDLPSRSTIGELNSASGEKAR